MMSIRVVSRGGEALGTPLAAFFGSAGGDIGRGADCTLVLPDPERRLSRKHVLVTCRDGVHLIRQIGANLDVELNGVPLAPGTEHVLSAGSQLRIGPYLLQASSGESGNAASAPTDVRPNIPSASRASVFSDVLRSGGAPAGGGPGAAAPAIDLLLGDAAPSLDEHALRALFDGLGIAVPASASADQLRLIGGLLRATVDGTLKLLSARTIAKRELGAAPTLLQTRENNPLKFSPDVDAALGHLLGPARSGFIAPLAAVHEAFDDLRAHELAVLAGMRAALSAVVARFDPAALEQRLTPKGVLDNLMPASRKARLWQAYGEQYAKLMQEVEDDFDSLFGRAFQKAYQAQLAELLRADAPPAQR